jgi:hypothetical protein
MGRCDEKSRFRAKAMEDDENVEEANEDQDQDAKRRTDLAHCRRCASISRRSSTHCLHHTRSEPALPLAVPHCYCLSRPRRQ